MTEIGRFGNGEMLQLHRRVPRRVAGELVTDGYGNIIYEDRIEIIIGVAVWPQSATETRQNQERSSINYMVVVPASIIIDAVDRITWRGKMFEVVGETERNRNPMTGSAVNSFVMNRVEG